MHFTGVRMAQLTGGCQQPERSPAAGTALWKHFTTNWLSQWVNTCISQKRAFRFLFDGWAQVLSQSEKIKFVESPSTLEELKTSFSFSLFVVFL